MDDQVIEPAAAAGSVPGVRQILGTEGPLGEMSAREVGLAGERIASSYLERRGLEVIGRNWRCPFGEADIVCRLARDAIVLVEVKTRMAHGGERGDCAPEVAVGEAKQRRYGNIALCYINEHPNVDSVRFDVVAITLNDGVGAHVHHIASAFSWDE